MGYYVIPILTFVIGNGLIISGIINILVIDHGKITLNYDPSTSFAYYPGKINPKKDIDGILELPTYHKNNIGSMIFNKRGDCGVGGDKWFE